MTNFNFITTHVGSVPYPSASGLTDKLVSMLDSLRAQLSREELESAWQAGRIIPLEKLLDELIDASAPSIRNKQ